MNPDRLKWSVFIYLMITPLIQVRPTQRKPTNVATKILTLATRVVKQKYMKA